MWEKTRMCFLMSVNFPAMASCPVNKSMNYAPVPVSRSRKPRMIRWTSFCGKPPNPVNPAGNHPGDRDAPAGISNAPRWPRIVWENILISMAAEWICSSRITKTRLPSPKALLDKNSLMSGCIMVSCASTMRRCPNR